MPLYLLTYFLSVLEAEPFNNAHLQFFSSFLISFRSTPFDRFPLSLSGTFPSAPPEGFCHPGPRKCLPPHPTRQCFTALPLSLQAPASLLQHRYTTNSAPKSRKRRAIFWTFPELVSPWDLCFYSCLSPLHILHSFSTQRSSKFVLRTLSTKCFFCTSLFYSFFLFLLHFFLLNPPTLGWCFPGSQVLSWVFIFGVPRPRPCLFSSKVLGSFTWLFFCLFGLRHHFSHIIIPLPHPWSAVLGDLDGPLSRSCCVPALPALPLSPGTPRTRGRSNSKLLAGAP